MANFGSLDEIQKRRLRALYESDRVAKIVLEHLATREKNSDETTVVALHQAIRQAGHALEYGEVRNAAKSIAAACSARFVRGRRGGKTRIIWNLPLIEVGRAAHVGDSQAAGVSTGQRNGATGEKTVRISIPLRPDFSLPLELPSDFTRTEASRLARVIENLPFAAERDVDASAARKREDE
jgi:hypothetical protein